MGPHTVMHDQGVKAPTIARPCRQTICRSKSCWLAGRLGPAKWASSWLAPDRRANGRSVSTFTNIGDDAG